MQLLNLNDYNAARLCLYVIWSRMYLQYCRSPVQETGKETENNRDHVWSQFRKKLHSPGWPCCQNPPSCEWCDCHCLNMRQRNNQSISGGQQRLPERGHILLSQPSLNATPEHNSHINNIQFKTAARLIIVSGAATWESVNLLFKTCISKEKEEHLHFSSSVLRMFTWSFEETH